MDNKIDLLATRAIVKPGLWAVLPYSGLVNNVVPFIDNCKVSIVASPKMGAGFVEYMIEACPGGGTSKPFGSESDIECFLYCIEGSIQVIVGEDTKVMAKGEYVYVPVEDALSFTNTSGGVTRLLLYKQRYAPLEGYSARRVWGSLDKAEGFPLHGMDNVEMKNLLPTDLGFDFNMHTLTFKPGAGHDFIETHEQEHGALILSGEGMYYMEDHWMGIKKDDFMWFGPYVPQAAYCVGTEDFAYLYSKDCNRDAVL
ncbi:MAG: (S)-ureidoglycine aminohydrolase [Lachnospiraceae bacterium]|nr:(S)-ureidoglycine aminohydrolase [Lachnospiraceae bacterium]